MNTENINERVAVVVKYLKSGPERDICFPYKMRYKGQDIVFTELGLRHPTMKGRRHIHVFDMSDGVNDYRLEFDSARLIWHLTAITGGFDV